ncbi:MAG: hypothetical protein CSB24_03425 [Deltaproteobacteria bacterium]|nr:MAG: hypothetical protein CSB24_03425 [Deltaproteobacteria bacterium]
MATSQKNFDQHFKQLVNEIHSAASPNVIMVGLRNKILKIYNVEMATIFLADAKNNKLVSWVLLGGDDLKKIRKEIDRSSLIGFSATTKKILNISDVYNDNELAAIDPSLKFDKSWDGKSGKRTRQVLVCPIVHKSNLMGVIQLINKVGKDKAKGFTKTDEERTSELAQTLGIALFNHYKSGRKVPMRYEELVNRNLIDAQEMERAMVMATQQERDVESILIDHFELPKAKLGSALASVYKTRFADLEQNTHSAEELIKEGEAAIFRKHLIVPLEKRDTALLMAAKNPADKAGIIAVKNMYKAEKISVLLAIGRDVRAVLDKFVEVPPEEDIYAGVNEAEEEPEEELDPSIYEKPEEVELDLPADNTPAVQLVNKIFEEAYYSGVSDIHIEPYGNQQDAEVRYRVDGVCKNVLNIAKENVNSVVARIKVLADLDISEKRKPQDGKIKFTTTQADKVELRVATLPTANDNEDVVLRILADSKPLPLSVITPKRIFKRLVPVIKKPYGIFLVVGPTGSGKTTTLHSVLNFINTPEKKIWTAEDPVEITQYRLRQVQVKPKIGYDFAAAMRAFLRADPDVIMIGEMRDQETTGMGIEASLTGHLVFSTLHTNSAAETIIRLMDMGMDPFNFSDALLGILAQRLIKTLCSECKEAYTPTRQEYDNLVHHYGALFFDNINIPYSPDLKLYRAVGCDVCNNSGYKGRCGLYELLIASKEIKEMIITKAKAEELKVKAIEEGMTVLLQEGIEVIFQGRTDLKQVMATCML